MKDQLFDLYIDNIPAVLFKLCRYLRSLIGQGSFRETEILLGSSLSYVGYWMDEVIAWAILSKHLFKSPAVRQAAIEFGEPLGTGRLVFHPPVD